MSRIDSTNLQIRHTSGCSVSFQQTVIKSFNSTEFHGSGYTRWRHTLTSFFSFALHIHNMYLVKNIDLRGNKIGVEWLRSKLIHFIRDLWFKNESSLRPVVACPSSMEFCQHSAWWHRWWWQSSDRNYQCSSVVLCTGKTDLHISILD